MPASFATPRITSLSDFCWWIKWTWWFMWGVWLLCPLWSCFSSCCYFPFKVELRFLFCPWPIEDESKLFSVYSKLVNYSFSALKSRISLAELFFVDTGCGCSCILLMMLFSFLETFSSRAHYLDLSCLLASSWVSWVISLPVSRPPSWFVA